MIRRMNRFLAIFLSVLFVLAMLPVGVLAEGAGDTDENISANDTEGGGAPVLEKEGLEQEGLEQDEPELFKSSWDPDDKITIKIRIFDLVSNKSYDNIGTDTCRKGDEKIQSDDYRIPPITKFINSGCTVDHVEGNWYFPATKSQQVGTTVNWSCNSSTGTMTYWTRGYVPEGEGTGGGETGDGSEEIGAGQYSMNCTVVYHSNYPSGTDYTQTFTYTIRAGYNIANTGYTLTVKTPAELRFTAPADYSLASPAWNTKANGTGSGINSTLRVTANSTTHLYAQWKSDQTAETCTLEYWDGTDQIGTTETYNSGAEVTVKGWTGAQPPANMRFLGWDDEIGPDVNVKYRAGDKFKIEKNTFLYAVWLEFEPKDYTVEHYKQLLDGTYPAAPDKRETLQGKAGEQTAAAAENYPGFTAQGFQQQEINADGSTVVKIYYERNSYQLTIDYVDQDGKTLAPQYNGTFKFEESYDVTSPAVAGYTPDKPKVSGNMQAGNVKVTVTYRKAANTHSLRYWNGTVQVGATERYNSGTEVTVKGWQGDPLAPNVMLLGWSDTPNETNVKYKEGDKFKIEKDTVLYAIFQVTQQNILDYTVEHYKQLLDGTYPDDPDERETLQGQEGTMTQAEAKNYPGFTAGTVQQKQITKQGVTVRIYYDRNKHTLTIDYVDQAGKPVAPQHTATLRYEATYDVSSPAVAGYTPDKQKVSGTMPDQDVKVTVTYTPVQNYGYTIHHVELGSNKQLAPDTVGMALLGATVVTASAKKDITGYAYHSDTGNIVIGTDAAANVATIYYMVPEIGMGSLKIKKTVTGEKGDKMKLFTFTVTFDRAVAYGDQASDTITFQLRHGESVTLPNIPEGTKYEVKESDYAGYRVSSSGAKGTIAAGKTSVASFVNSKGPIPITGDSGSKVLGAVIMGASILAIIGLVYADRKLGKRKNAR